MKKIFAAVFTMFLLMGCSRGTVPPAETVGSLAAEGEVMAAAAPYTRKTKISDVMEDPVFGDFGRLIFPANTSYYSGETLEELQLTWYNDIDPDKTVEIVNIMYAQAAASQQIFYDIYSAEEKAADPAKENTGLFFFKGEPGAKFAVCCAGGGFAYVGAMQDSFPHALELSKKDTTPLR